MKRFLQLLFLVSLPLFTSAQYHFSFSHYTSDNGLSQNTITVMMKDSKGYLWFGTRDGLNKFDGYNFKAYNSKLNSKLSVLSNRILDVKEDRWGFIWVKTYDEIVYRLNTSTEELIRIENPSGGLINDKIAQIVVLPSGVVWLTTTNMGCYKIVTNEEDIAWFLNAVDNPHNGLTFCAGSLSAGEHNDTRELQRSLLSVRTLYTYAAQPPCRVETSSKVLIYQEEDI